MGSDMVYEQDKKQGGPDAVWCMNKAHGRLTCHGNGQVLVCGKCDYVVPVSR